MTALQAAERSPSVVATIATTLLDLRDPDNLSLTSRGTVLARVGLFFMKHAISPSNRAQSRSSRHG